MAYRRRDARRGVSRRASAGAIRAGSAGYSGALGFEARAAVDGAVESRHEWDGGVTAAARACYGRAFAATARCALAAAADAADRAALRLIEEPFLQVEPLLARSEREHATAITTSQRLIFKCHRFPSLRQVVKLAAVGRMPSSGPRMRQIVGQVRIYRQAILS